MIITLVLKERKIKFDLMKQKRQGLGYYDTNSNIKINKIIYRVCKNHTAILNEKEQWIWKAGQSEDYRVYSVWDIIEYLNKNIKVMNYIEKIVELDIDNHVIIVDEL